MKIINVDWSRTGEMKWEKQMCPICNEPTGHRGRCFGDTKSSRETFSTDLFDDADSENEERGPTNKTIEYQGQLVPIMSESCIFKQFNNYIIELNYPISKPLAVLIANIEGVEKFSIESKYRGTITIGNLFDETEVKMAVTKVFRDFIKFNREKLEEFTKQQQQEKNEKEAQTDATS